MATLNNHRDRPHWSYSSLNGLLNICSLQWAFERIEKLPRAFTPINLALGSAFHRGMEWIALTRKEGQKPSASHASDLFQDLLARELKEDPDIRYEEGMDRDACLQGVRDQAVCAVEHLDPEEQVLEINQAFAVPVIDAAGCALDKPLIGEIDCIVEKGGKRTVVDWKTSGRRWPKDQASRSLQPTTYVYARQQLTGVQEDFRFDVLVKNKTPVFEQHTTTRTVDDFHRLAELVRKADAIVEHELFTPSDQSFFCSSCPYQEPCRSWHRNLNRTLSVAA